MGELFLVGLNQPTTGRRHWWRATALLSLALSLAVIASVLMGLPGRATAAEPNTIYVNSTAYTTATTGCTPGNDTFTAPATNPANTCTLRAALTYANTNSTTENPITVTLATGFAAAGGGNITISTDDSSYKMSSIDPTELPGSGVIYLISKPMTIDLQNKLGVKMAGDWDSTTIYITGSNVILLNASNIYNGENAIAISGNAHDVLISGGATRPLDNWYSEQFLVIEDGARNVTFENYTVGNLYTSASNGDTCTAAVCFIDANGDEPNGSTAASQGITISNIHFENSATSTTCSETNSTGCESTAIMFAQDSRITPDASGKGVEVTGCTFSGITRGSHFALTNYGASNVNISGLDFHDNQIGKTYNCSDNSIECSTIHFTSGVNFTGNNLIRNNTFINPAGTNQAHAIGVNLGRASNGVANLTIQDNHFDGYYRTAMWLNATGSLTVQRNTMGVNTFSASNTTQEPTGDNGQVMLNNNDDSANGKIRTWYPSTAALDLSCTATIMAVAPTTAMVQASRIPATPVRLDVYWTGLDTAEIFLGSTTPTITNSPYPIEVVIPDDVRDQILDPDGKATGYIRLQTQSMATNPARSSQYSETVKLTGQCHNVTVDAIADGTGIGPVEGSGTLHIEGTGFAALTASQLTVTLNGDAACTPVTIVSDTLISCTVPASTREDSRTGPVDITVSVAGSQVAVFENGYTYTADGDLTVVKRAWTDVPSGLTNQEVYDLAMSDDPGASGMAELPTGAIVAPGSTIWWTYTVHYAYLVNGEPYDGLTGDAGLTDVVVTDDQLDDAVCTIDVVFLNTPAGCAASGIVGAS